MERNIYLSNTDIEEALSIYFQELGDFTSIVKEEIIDIRDGLGRVTSSPLFAKFSSPNHNAAAMDGVMVRAKCTYGASEANPLILTRGIDFAYINTGGLITDPYDAVIMVEDIVPAALPDEDGEAGRIKITAAASPWQHIRPIGEDIVSGEMLLPANHRLRPADIGAALSSGVTQVAVYEKIRLAIIPTGNEITDCYDKLDKGKIFDSNSWMFKAAAEQMGALAGRISPVEDDNEKLKEAVSLAAAKNHIVIINAGSSAGSKDYTASVIQDMGRLVLHGLAIKPGKPTVLGVVGGKPVLGVPGYPGSAFLVFEEIVCPIIAKLQHVSQRPPDTVQAILSRRIVSSLKYREYVRVKLGKVNEKLIATPLNRGAGVTMALVKADGLIVIPRQSEGSEAGETVQTVLISDINQIERTLVSIGSHDLIMDILGNIMAKSGFCLSSAHVGSMGGILALKRREAHIAPIHLMDEATGEYNASYLKTYLPDRRIKLVKGVKREQGFIVRPGNPKGIFTPADLARENIRFVNRQKGSGTRILTDYLLEKEGVDKSQIIGYNREMTTHMTVASAVESGAADAGVGVASAAAAMGLDFIFIGNEEYDFAIAEEYIDTPMVQAFLQALSGEEFLGELKKLGGYGV